MKKVLHGLLVMGAAAVISVGATSYAAEAAAPAPANYNVDYANQKINVTDTGKNTKIYVSKATVTQRTDKKSGQTVTTVRTAAATEYDLTASKATIDISSFGVTKDVYLSVKGNVTTDSLLIKIPAAKTKLKATVDAVNAKVQVQDVSDKKNPVDIANGGVEYCSSNGNWATYNKDAAGKTPATSLTDYTALGTTLRFRVKASASAALGAAEKIGDAADGSSVMASVGKGNFASNELKVKIAKTANGPKATIDYNSRTVKIPVTSEYRNQAPATALTAFKAAPAAEGRAKVVSLSIDSLNTAKGTEFDLRTAVTPTKPASKITEYTFKAGSTLTSSATGTQAPAKFDVTRANAITGVDLSVTKLVLSSKTMAGTMTVKNGTADGYQFIVADAQDAATVAKLTLPTASDKVTGTVAAGKTANIKVKSGQYVYVRKAANIKTQDWSTPYVYYGIVMNTKD